MTAKPHDAAKSQSKSRSATIERQAIQAHIPPPQHLLRCYRRARKTAISLFLLITLMISITYSERARASGRNKITP